MCVFCFFLFSFFFSLLLLLHVAKVWELVPESRRYWWTDLIQTPFENLSEMEKFGLFRKWRKTLMVANNLWTGSELGKYGRVRPHYDDPWPAPITKLDIWNKEYYQEIDKMNDPNYDESIDNVYNLDKYIDPQKQKKLQQEDLLTQNMFQSSQFMLNGKGNDDDTVEAIDLEAYYGLKGESTEVDQDDPIPENVVYQVKHKKLS